jgi:hypothetical protein
MEILSLLGGFEELQGVSAFAVGCQPATKAQFITGKRILAIPMIDSTEQALKRALRLPLIRLGQQNQELIAAIPDRDIRPAEDRD